MIRPANLTREQLRQLLEFGAKLANAARTALEESPAAERARVSCCTAGAHIADLLCIRSAVPNSAPAAELVDVAASDAAETLDLDPED